MKVCLVAKAKDTIKCSNCKQLIIPGEKVYLQLNEVWDGRLFVDGKLCQTCASIRDKEQCV